ncbi:uncharacterized protein [Periplaneta americana]|uniref:uncharacterized protein isoform X2 n=1 Tax=Periplaneta americana TaxID=6978 RepID=UPI0037E770FF
MFSTVEDHKEDSVQIPLLKMASSPDIFQWLGESYTVSTSENIWENTSWTYQEQNTSNLQYNKSSFPDFIHLLNDKALEEHTTLPFTTSAAHLGLSTGLLLAILLNSRLDAIKAKSFLVCFETMVLRFLFAAICLVLTLAAAPILGLFTVFLMCYRQGIHLFLKATRPHYVSLLDGLDAVWAIEEETNKSVINVLALIEVENIEQGRNLLENFRKTVIGRFTKSPLPCPKIFYFRRKCLGYFYWERQTELRIQDYIRSMTVIHEESATNNENNVSSEISEETLNTLIAEVCNSKLPANHAACWEILVGSQSIKKSPSQTADVFQALEEGIPEEPSTGSLLYPILFRVHHSLGDGIALMHLLVSAMADILPCVGEEIPTPLSIPPPMPIPNRKFPSNSNSSLKTVISGTNNTCCEPNENTAYFRHEVQSPKIEVNHIISSDNCQKLRKHIENCKTLKQTLTRTDAEEKLADSEVSLNVQSDKENDIQFIDKITEGACQISEGNESITYIPLKQLNSCTAINKEERCPDSYRRRPLLLTNHNSNPCQQSTEYPGLNSSQHQLCYTKTLQDEHSIISKHYPSSNFKNIIKDSKFEPGYKLTGSYNQSLNRKVTSNDFSQAFTSNLHNSLPVLTSHQHSSLNKKALQKQSSNTNIVKSECFSTNSLASFQEFPFMGSITKCIQDSTCSSPTKSRVYLEELQTSSSKLERPTTIHLSQKIESQKRPPVCLLFEKDHYISKSASKSTQDIPYFNGDHCNTTKLHCYNRSTSDSYITVPEELAFSSEPVIPTSDKGTNTSTTIYYYNNSSAFKSDVSSQALQETDNCVADAANKIEHIPCNNNTSNHVSSRLVAEKRNSRSERSNDNFERNNCTTATQTSPHVPSPCRSSLLSDAVHLQRPTDNTQLDLTEWNIVDMQIATELGTITEEEVSDKKEPIPSDSHYPSHATTYPDHNNSFVKNINSAHDSKGTTDIKLCHETENINHFIDNCNATTCTAPENADEPHLTSTNGRFKFDKLKKIWSSVTSDENNSENKQTLSSESQLRNQYVELLNTISNSNSSLSKYDRLSNLIQKACALALAPASLIHQALMRDADVNSLHGPLLSGQKVVAWHQDPTGDLLKCIKRVKKNSNNRFTEVFLTALSASLETYFETHKTASSDKVPEVVTVVVPARMEYLSTKQITNVNLTPEMNIKTEKVGNSDVTVPFILQENSDISRHSASDRTGKHCAEFKASHLEKEDIPLPKYTGTDSKTSEDEMRDWVNSNEVREEYIIQLPSQECEDMSQDKTVLLNNRFSLALLTLPITSATVNMKEGSGNAYKTLSPRRRLNEVHHYSELLRKGLDYQVNYWLLRVAATFLPASLLEAVIRSSQSSLVVSNIVGPTQELSLAGNRLRTMMFWIPNRDTTGIGVTVLSYHGHLQIGIIADKALITSKQDAQMILDETVLELYKLDAVISE